MTPLTDIQRHRLGVTCGIAAGAWLGLAEAPMKLVATGLSPLVVSLGMVAGVFLARFTLPALLKGSDYIVADVRERPHLIAWALIAGMLWAVANALTAFAIRDVGLAVAFPLWNLNSLVGLFWAWLLFGELPAARDASTVKVVGGVAALLAGAGVITWASTLAAPAAAAGGRTAAGIVAALGAALLWGTMYVPYRKAYISGMNPLSFVAIFTVGELVTAALLAVAFAGGVAQVTTELSAARPVLFWLFLGGFCWVIGDLFQQYAAKYVGIARGIPLSNTNQLWGLSWGVLVFGELADAGPAARTMIVGGSVVMALGAVAISRAAAPAREVEAWRAAVTRECDRYGLDDDRVMAALRGEDPLAAEPHPRRWWEWLTAAAALGIAVWLASYVEAPAAAVSVPWAVVLGAIALAILAAGGLLLWRRTRFS